MLILTVNRVTEPLSAVTVALITGTPGPTVTHVPARPDSSQTKEALLLHSWVFDVVLHGRTPFPA